MCSASIEVSDRTMGRMRKVDFGAGMEGLVSSRRGSCSMAEEIAVGVAILFGVRGICLDLRRTRKFLGGRGGLEETCG